ncbi:MAG: iron-containing alcohol dehydrogenase [Dissulfuribacterales bacterium]
MDNFEYQNSTRIIFGKGEVSKIGRVVRPFGSNVLLVTGRESLKKSGLYQKVKDRLEEEGISVVDLDGVRSNPLLSRVRDGIRMAKDYGIQAVLGIGGGSVMDTAKAVAAGAVMEQGDVWDFFTGERTVEKALPVITVPTLAASGSEMNGFMVITDEESRHKLAAGSLHLYPRVSILDPTTTYTVSADYTAYGGVDAVCHLLEPYFNGPDPNTPLQDRMAEGLIRTIMDTTEACIKSPEDYESRATMMWASSLALCGLTKAGVGDHHFPVHLIEHAVSALFSVAHGEGLAALLPGWMTWWAQDHPEKTAQLGERIWGISGKDVSEKSEACIDALRSWFDNIGCPKNLSDIGIKTGDHERLAENAVFQAEIWGMSGTYSVENIKNVLAYCQG